MSEALLRTKLFAPPLRARLVQRQHLVSRLNQGLRDNCKLTVISAPAGFGKTTVIAEWQRQLTGPDRPGSVCPDPRFAWLSLDDDDNAPDRFLHYLLTALQEIIPPIGDSALALLRAPQPPSVESVLIPVLNEIASLSGEGALSGCCYMLVLDDYHVISAEPIHDYMAFLLEHLPRPMHLVICSRSDMPWSLSRLRAGGQVMELRSADLRFGSDEVAEFLNSVMELDLTTAELTALENRTEGWIAGLQLAALSMRDLDAQDRRGFVAAFAGSHRFVVDYLIDEVLARRPAGTKRFLLQTSILDRMCGPLCDAVLANGEELPAEEGASDTHEGAPSPRNPTSQEILEQLEQANLFIVPLDDVRQWYRYHHLFKEVLRIRLRQSFPEAVAELHLRASIWFEAGAHWDEAIRHALAAGAVVRAARLVEENAPNMLARSELAQLMRWVQALPDDLVRQRPWLSVYHAWALRLTGARYEKVQSRLSHVERALETIAQRPTENASLPEPTRRHIKGHLLALHAYQALYAEQLRRAQALGSEALALMPADDFMRSSVYLAVGWTERFSGNLEAAGNAFVRSRDISLAHGNLYIGAAAICRLAYTRILAGQLHQAEEACKEALGMATLADGRRLPVAGYALVYLGAIHREWNDLDSAVRCLTEGIDLCAQVGYVVDQIVAYSLLARTRMAQKQWAAAQEACLEAETLSQQMKGYTYALRWAQDCQVRLWLARGESDPGDLANAARWAESSGLRFDDELDFVHELAHLILARVLVARGRLDPGGRALQDAHLLLDRLAAMAEAAGWHGKLVEILALRALAFQAGGKSKEALAAVQRALSLAVPQNYTRVFLDEGKPMAGLIHEAAAQGLYAVYSGTLLTAFLNEEPERSTPDCAQASVLVEPLSPRELEVLRLIATGATNAQIALQLFIAVGTVKNHAKNIYGKLDVHNRAQAVAQARALGLLA